MARIYRKWRMWSPFVLLLAPLTTQAELTVIYDSGHTEPMAPFLEPFDSNEENPPPDIRSMKPQIGAADPKTWLPIQSPGLTPGFVQTRSHDLPFARPYFLIGSDQRSQQWLSEHRTQLKEIGAVGMLVQADTVDDLAAIAALADGLPILPASASDIGKALEISHYPVLISAHTIEQ